MGSGDELEGWTQKMDSKRCTQELDSLDGLRLLIVNCMEERGEDPPGLCQFITPATFPHSNVREASYHCIELTDYLTKCIWEPTKTSRMRRSYASGRRASLIEGRWGKKQKNAKRLFSKSKICATITLYEPVSGLVGQIQFCLLQAEWHPRALGHHLDVEV